MKVKLTVDERKFLMAMIPAGIHNLEQQLERLQVVQTQAAELRELREVVEKSVKNDDTLDLNDQTTSFLMKLLRSHQFDKVESLVVKLLSK